MSILSLPAFLLPMCDWHHVSGPSSSDLPADPAVDAYVVTVFTAAGIGLFASLFSGGLLVAYTRRIRNLFWAIPAVNLAAYAAFIFARPYPGGRAAQFRGTGLVHTLIGCTLLLLISLALATAIALIRLVIRLIRFVRPGRHLPPPLPVHAHESPSCGQKQKRKSSESSKID